MCMQKPAASGFLMLFHIDNHCKLLTTVVVKMISFRKCKGEMFMSKCKGEMYMSQCKGEMYMSKCKGTEGEKSVRCHCSVWLSCRRRGEVGAAVYLLLLTPHILASSEGKPSKFGFSPKIRRNNPSHIPDLCLR